MDSLINTAAWAPAHQTRPFEIKLAPVGSPKESHILVKNHAIGINPIDWKLQRTGIHRSDLTYPTIYGQDVAGEVIAVGPGVNDFEVGDRVFGVTKGFLTGDNAEKAFQTYTVLSTCLCAKIPTSIPYDLAATASLGFTTAAAALFDPSCLHLHLPTEPSRDTTGQILLILGGASGVGGSAIQLAVSAGYQVVATSSPKNFPVVRNLGASFVVDYLSENILPELLAIAKGRQVAGIFDAIGVGTTELAQEFAAATNGGKLVITTMPGWPKPPQGVEVKHVNAVAVAMNQIGKAVWVDYLPKALEAGTFRFFLEPLHRGKGLESLQSAVDYLHDNAMSAQKVVVTL